MQNFAVRKILFSRNEKSTRNENKRETFRLDESESKTRRHANWSNLRCALRVVAVHLYVYRFNNYDVQNGRNDRYQATVIV